MNSNNLSTTQFSNTNYSEDNKEINNDYYNLFNNELNLILNNNFNKFNQNSFNTRPLNNNYKIDNFNTLKSNKKNESDINEYKKENESDINKYHEILCENNNYEINTNEISESSENTSDNKNKISISRKDIKSILKINSFLKNNFFNL